MAIQDIKQLVIERIKSLSMWEVSSNGIQWTVRCPYCGDSTNKSHGHFSIKIDPETTDPMVYRCLKCNESGVVTDETLDDIGVYLDTPLKEDLKANNKLARSKHRPRGAKANNYLIPIDFRYRNSKNKINYLQERLGIEYNTEMIQSNRIIVNFTDFLAQNELKVPPGISDGMRSLLDSTYVGFLSSNGNKIVFRNISDQNQFNRYFKVTIDPYDNSSNNFYTLPSRLNILYTGDVNIRVAEGTFDILSVYYNLDHPWGDNDLFFASCGYGFSRILKYCIGNGINTGLNLHIYSDADKPDREHQFQLRGQLYQVYLQNIYVHRNLSPNEKDFGVPKERIEERIYKFK